MDRNDQVTLEWRPFGLSIPQLLLIALLISVSVIGVVAMSTSTAGFSPYNANWDGTAEFRNLANANGETTIVTSVEQYEGADPASTTAFVLAPEKNYSDSDRELINRFVQNGGLLIVADDYEGNGNTVLRSVNASARFDGRILRDEQNNFESSFFPSATNTSTHTLVSNVDGLTFNYGTTIRPGTARPIVNSSSVSYLVDNRNESLEPQTDLRRYPVVTVESVGEGTVVAIGDPSIFISSMLDKSDNRAFISALLGERSEILLDQSHSQSLPILVSLTLALRSSPPVAGGILTILVGLVLVGNSLYDSRGQRVWRQRFDSLVPADQLGITGWPQSDPNPETQTLISDRESLKEELQQRHPEWDEEQTDRVIAGVLSDTPYNLANERFRNTDDRNK
jgi:hypothetical protein